MKTLATSGRVNIMNKRVMMMKKMFIRKKVMHFEYLHMTAKVIDCIQKQEEAVPKINKMQYFKI